MPRLVVATTLLALLLSAAPAWADMHRDLRLAAAKGDREEAAMLLLVGARVDSQDEYGFTPLHWAVYQGSLSMVEFLVERGAPLNARSKDGYTPLMIAVSRDYAPIAHLLLDHGADVKLKTPKGTAAIDFARQHNRMDLIDRLEPPRMAAPRLTDPAPSIEPAKPAEVPKAAVTAPRPTPEAKPEPEPAFSRPARILPPVPPQPPS